MDFLFSAFSNCQSVQIPELLDFHFTDFRFLHINVLLWLWKVRVFLFLACYGFDFMFFLTFTRLDSSDFRCLTCWHFHMFGFYQFATSTYWHVCVFGMFGFDHVSSLGCSLFRNLIFGDFWSAYILHVYYVEVSFLLLFGISTVLHSVIFLIICSASFDGHIYRILHFIRFGFWHGHTVLLTLPLDGCTSENIVHTVVTCHCAVGVLLPRRFQQKHFSQRGPTSACSYIGWSDGSSRSIFRTVGQNMHVRILSFDGRFR